MTNEQNLVATILIAIAVAGTIAYLIPRLVKKGINVDGIIASVSAGLARADVATDTLRAAAPDNAGLLMLDKVVDWSQQAVAAAEQLYKTHQLDGDKRKAEAAKLVHKFAAAAGVKVTKPLDDVIDGAIEAAVYVLPKTGKAEPAPDDGAPQEALPEKTE